jgi:hypothetical protein
VALAATDDAPRIHVDDWKVLRPPGSKRIIEVITVSSRLVPGILGITKKHAQEVTSARLAVDSLVCFTSMHDAQVVNELDVTLLAIELALELLCELCNQCHGKMLLVRDFGHARVAGDERCTHEWRFH